MDQVVEVSFLDLCRLCANPCPAPKRVQFFGADSLKYSLPKKLRKYLSLSVEENDGFPGFACMPCISRLCVFDKLHRACKEANERLQALKKQLDLESRASVSKPTPGKKVGAASSSNLSQDLKSDIYQEMKGSYEMMPDSENSCVTVILPTESKDNKSLPRRSLVLVNVPTQPDHDDNDSKDEKGGASLPEQDLFSRELNQTMEKVVEEAKTNLESGKIDMNDGLRRSSRPRVQNRFYGSDGDNADTADLHVCSICDISFANLKKLLCHQRSHSHITKAEAKNLFCSKCTTAFESPLELKTHLCKPLFCEVCRVTFSSEKEKEQHMLLHQGPFTCDFCRATFSSLEVLQNHILCHTAAANKKRLFQCKICGKLYKSRIGLTCHETNHSEHRPYPCYICHSNFQSKHDLMEHRAAHTKEEKELGKRFKKPKPFPCDVCHKTLSSKAGLEVHMRMHRDEKPFECSECGKLFRQEIKLKYHYRLHIGDLPYGCTLCEKRFNTQRQLDTHKRAHTNERPFICEVCGLGFRSSGVLGRHKITHSEEPLFACSLCGKKFRTRHATTTHERTHTEDKRLMCDVCGRSFNHRRTLDKHRLRHEKQRVPCLECNTTFGSKKGLRKHIERKHTVTVMRPVQIFETVRSSEFVTLTVPSEELIVEVVV